ncbi:CHAT domain-containing protein [Kitasatospora nipponensis]|uniref:CHAT domain-containing protein n=1 Tax=Kitasatospora nipponensis TaxID=258049 RepID=UPI0031CF96F8
MDADFWFWYYGLQAQASLQGFEETRDPAVLDHAIELLAMLLDHDLFPAGSPAQRVQVLERHAMALMRRYYSRSDRADLESAIQSWEMTLSLAPPGTSQLGAMLNNLATAIQCRDDPADIDRIVDLNREAVALTDANDPDTLSVRLSNLGVALRLVALRLGNPADMDETVRVCRRAVDIGNSDPGFKCQIVNNLSVILHDRYDRSGDADDLAESIKLTYEAIATAPVDFMDAWGFQSNLGSLLRHQYERSGVLSFLDDSIGVLRKAASAPAGWHGLPLCLTNLSSSLNRRALHSNSPEFARESALSAAQAVALTPLASASAVGYQCNFIGTLAKLAEQTGEGMDSLAASIDSVAEMVAQLPEDSPRRDSFEANLSHAYLVLYRHRRNPADLTAAEQLRERSLERADAGSPRLLYGLAALGQIKQLRWQHSLSEEDVAIGRQAYEQLCATGMDTEPSTVLGGALAWASWAEERDEWNEAASAYRAAAQAVRQLFSAQVLRQDKESWLIRARSLPGRTAVALARAGDVPGAVLALDGLRALLLTEAMDRAGADLSRLREGRHKDLATRFQLLAGELARIANSYEEQPAASTDGSQLRASRAELDRVTAQIRRVPGWEQFLLPSDAADIADSRDATLIYLAIAQRGGVALVVPASPRDDSWRDRAYSVDLPGLTEESVRRQVDLIRQAQPLRHTQSGLWQGSLDSVGRWLGRTILEPLAASTAAGFEHLAPPGHGSASATFANLAPALADVTLRVIPTGILGLLPIHAAWTEDERTTTGRRYFLDSAALTHTPNARSAVRGRRTVDSTGRGGLLMVSTPSTRELASLPLADAQAAAVAQQFGDVTTLSGGKATRAAVLSALGHSNVHFNCHGISYPDRPLDSHLVLSDEQPLTVRELLGAASDRRVHLVALAACETQVAGEVLPDEVVSLPSAFLQLGAAGVLAAQWPVRELATTIIMIRFYREWTTTRNGPAALRAAQLWLRDTHKPDLLRYFHPTEGSSCLQPDVARQIWLRLLTRVNGFESPIEWAAWTYTGV